MSTSKWYAARHHANVEACYPLMHLARQGFEALAPVMRQRRLKRGRLVVVEQPVFRGYLFVNFDILDWAWRKINSTYGVAHLLPVHSETPSPIPADFIEELRISVTVHDLDRVVQRYERDQMVRVLTGALRDYIGKVLSSTSRSTRVKLLMLDGRELVATVPTNKLAPVAEA